MTSPFADRPCSPTHCVDKQNIHRAPRPVLADTQWAVRHVLQYCAKARVLEPESARVAVREALERIMAAS